MLAHETANCPNTIRQTKIAAFVGIWVADTPFVKMLCPQKKLLVNIL